jgi:hypothetical protein
MILRHSRVPVDPPRNPLPRCDPAFFGRTTPFLELRQYVNDVETTVKGWKENRGVDNTE